MPIRPFLKRTHRILLRTPKQWIGIGLIPTIGALAWLSVWNCHLRWKKTVPVDFSFSFSQWSAQANTRLTIQSVILTLQEIEVVGKRIDAPDVNVHRQWNEPYILQNGSTTYMEIPQGEYAWMETRLRLGTRNEPALRLSGTLYLNGRSAPVQIALWGPLTLRLRVMPATSAANTTNCTTCQGIVTQSTTSTTTTLTLWTGESPQIRIYGDVSNWLMTVPHSLWEEALNQDSTQITIDAAHNNDIYALLMSELSQHFSALFQKN